MKKLITLLVLASLVTTASAATATFGRDQTGAYANETIDMVSIGFSIWSVPTYGKGTGTDLDARMLLPGTTTGGLKYQNSGYVTLFGLADLGTLVPATSGGDAIVIDSASVQIFNDTYVVVTNMYLSRVKTDWLLGTAGSNQDVVNADATSASTEWATNADAIVGANPNGDADVKPTSFGASDFDGTSTLTQTQGGWASSNTWDVTSLLQAAYDAGELYGWVIETEHTGLARNFNDAGDRDSGNLKTAAYDPQVLIEYHYEAIPEPATMGMLLVGGLGVLARRRRR